MSPCHQLEERKSRTKMKSFLYLSLLLFAATANARKTRPSGSTAAPTTTTAADDGTSSGYGPTIAALTSTDSVETSSNCGDDATGYYEEYVTDNARYVIVSGAPKHEAEYNQEKANPNTRCERWQYVKLPLTWSDSGSTTKQMGATGYVTSGAVTYDARSNGTNGDLATYYEQDFFDPYNGHSDAFMQYHYHAVCVLRIHPNNKENSICNVFENHRYPMDGQVPMILMHVNTLVTCMMEPNFMDFAVTWILAMSRIVVVMQPMKVTTPTPMMMTANWMNATCTTWMERWFMS